MSENERPNSVVIRNNDVKKPDFISTFITELGERAEMLDEAAMGIPQEIYQFRFHINKVDDVKEIIDNLVTVISMLGYALDENNLHHYFGEAAEGSGKLLFINVAVTPSWRYGFGDTHAQLVGQDEHPLKRYGQLRMNAYVWPPDRNGGVTVLNFGERGSDDRDIRGAVW